MIFKTMAALVGTRTWQIDGNFQWNLDAPENSVEAVLQNVWNVLTTPVGSQFLLRAFGTDTAWIDQPGNIGTMQGKVAALLSIAQWEPRCKILSLKFSLDPTNYIRGIYSLFLQCEIDLSVTITQTIFVAPAAAPAWVLDGPIGGPFTPTLENITA
jgi:phage baseplate assembly protein W